MSAWIVSKNHIRLLVEACFKYEIVTEFTPNDLGTLLWEENHRSVNYRYQEEGKTPDFTHDSTQIREKMRDPVLLLAQIRCYDYQTCEHPEYAQSLAAAIIECLQEAVLHGLGQTLEQVRNSAAWDQAPWGID